MAYLIESHWHYAEDERYNAGRGLASFKDTLAEAEHLFSLLANDHGYAVDLKDCSTGAVIKHAGPETKAAIASMHKAYQRRSLEAA